LPAKKVTLLAMSGYFSCNDLNGYWCDPAEVSSSASELTGVTDFTNRPSSTFLCYDEPCSSGDCDKGDEDFEKYSSYNL